MREHACLYDYVLRQGRENGRDGEGKGKVRGREGEGKGEKDMVAEGDRE